MAAPRNDNVRQRILQTTMNLMTRTSFEGVSLARIASEAGISKGTLYYHFNNKDALLLALADFYLQQQRANLLRWTAESQTSLHQLVSYVVRQDVLAAPLRMQLYAIATQGNAAIREKLCEFYSSYHELVTQKLAERATGISADFLGWLILLSADGMYVQDAIQNQHMELDTYLTATADALQQFLK